MSTRLGRHGNSPSVMVPESFAPVSDRDDRRLKAFTVGGTCCAFGGFETVASDLLNPKLLHLQGFETVASDPSTRICCAHSLFRVASSTRYAYLRDLRGELLLRCLLGHRIDDSCGAGLALPRRPCGLMRIQLSWGPSYRMRCSYWACTVFEPIRTLDPGTDCGRESQPGHGSHRIIRRSSRVFGWPPKREFGHIRRRETEHLAVERQARLVRADHRVCSPKPV